MNEIIYSIAKDYSRKPGLRYRKQSDFSGEDFREAVLLGLYDRAVNENRKLIINLDNTFGYGPSFLEESFGGLARQRTGDILSVIAIVSEEEPYLIDEIKDYIIKVRDGQ